MSKFLKFLPRDREVITQQLAMKVILSKELWEYFLYQRAMYFGCIFNVFNFMENMQFLTWLSCLSLAQKVCNIGSKIQFHTRVANIPFLGMSLRPRGRSNQGVLVKFQVWQKKLNVWRHLGGQFRHWVVIGRHWQTLHNAREMLITATRVEKTPINIKKNFLVFKPHEMPLDNSEFM